ncbi:MAG TPA: NADH:flavin oxidoreductase/NADH oxidase [Candidatus Dormibacteraeota bacterium]|nr:NADH:flavin oxidoreductase/NADH oxidase [Candidatus Dormibacteraeota bacterium]
MAHLFEALTIRGVTLRNRIAVSPMCQYSCVDGLANDWHFVHLGSRAVGGAAIVFCEATAVTPEARISPEDLGIWSDLHAEALARIVRFIHEQGSLAGIQLAHAGRKASTYKMWAARHGEVPASEGGWTDVVAPSAIKFQDDYPQPREMTREEIRGVTKAFAAAARRALDAGFDVVETHAAHGYLIDEFLSPLSNFRHDEYGGTFENRTRFAREVTQAVRAEWPERQPLFMRISATDWQEGGWDIEQSVELTRAVKEMGVDLMDCSSGGIVPGVKIPVGAGYQAGFAERIRHDAGILTGTVGMITEPVQADHVIRSGQADIVLLAREMLRNPYWPLRAARELGQPASWPPQYLRAAPEKSPTREPVKREVEEMRAIAEAARR